MKPMSGASLFFVMSIMSCAACTSGTTAVSTAPTSSAGTPNASPSHATDNPRLAPTPNSALLEAAQTIYSLGIGAYRDIFADVRLDQPNNRLILSAIDVRRAQQMVTESKRARPETSAVVVFIDKCQYTREAEDTQLDRLMQAQRTRPFLYQIFAGGGNNGAGIVVTVSPEATKSEAFKAQVRNAVSPMAVTFQAGGPAVGVSAGKCDQPC